MEKNENVSKSITALAWKNFNSTLFYHFKKLLYYYIIQFYNTSDISKLYFY